MTQLHVAAANGDVESVKLLLARGEEPDRLVDAQPQDNCHAGLSAMHLATEADAFECLQALVGHGGNIDLPGGAGRCAGQTALHMAVSVGNLRAIRVILDLGANTALQITEGALIGATALELAVTADNEDAVGALLDAGVDPHRPASTGGMGVSPVHMAAACGCVNALNAFRSRGVWLDGRAVTGACKGRTPLQLARMMLACGAVEWLLLEFLQPQQTLSAPTVAIRPGAGHMDRPVRLRKVCRPPRDCRH